MDAKNGPEPKTKRRRGAGRATLQDVARIAGVTAMTVSRTINRPDTVSEANRDRVQAAIEELNYIPDRYAGALASQRTRIVTVIVPVLSRRVFNDIVHGANQVLGPAGYQVLFSNTYSTLAEEEAICRAILGWRPEGIIVSGVDHTEGARALLRESGVTVVEALELGADPIDINIGCDHFAVGIRMAGYLIGKGYRRIGFVGGELDRDFRAARRRAGFRQALADNGVPCVHDDVFPEPNTYDSGILAMRRLIESRTAVDAIFCVNDDLAVGAIFEAQRRNLRVPGDIAIAGFSGLDISAAVFPSLTTIASPRYRMGELAARAILDRAEGRHGGPDCIDVGFDLIQRESA